MQDNFKKELFINLLSILVIILLTVYYAHQFTGNKNKTASSSSATSNLNGTVVLSMGELAKHNKTTDCWLLIQGKVYDVTNYLTVHPGGVGTIEPYCGKEATDAFLTRGGTGSHSNAAFQDLTQFLLGDLNSKVDLSKINNTNNQTNPSTTQEDGD